MYVDLNGFLPELIQAYQGANRCDDHRILNAFLLLKKVADPLDGYSSCPMGHSPVVCDSESDKGNTLIDLLLILEQCRFKAVILWRLYRHLHLPW